MKKKLIAMVASLAMVATMVPASAFAATNVVQVWSKDGYISPNVTVTSANDANLDYTIKGNTIQYNGVLPYHTKALPHYVEADIHLDDSTAACHWWQYETGKLHTIQDKGVSQKTKTITTTDLTKVTDTANVVLSNQKFGVDGRPQINLAFYEIADAAFSGAPYNGVAGVDAIWYGTGLKESNWETGVATKFLDDTTALSTLLKGLDKNNQGPAEFTLDTRNVTLLSEDDTEAIEDFVDSVNDIAQDANDNALNGGNDLLDIKDQVIQGEFKTYKRHTDSADRAYAALTDYQKSVIAGIDAQESKYNYKKAYEALQIAKKNVESAELLPGVTDAIAKLAPLPESFKDKAAIDAIKAPLEAALTAYEKLSTDAKNLAQNEKQKLDAYKTNYDTKVKAYADALYAKAVKLDTANLSDADAAVIKELQTVVEGGYLPTRNIAGFVKADYDKLLAALNAAASLEKAKISDIADQTYDGTAKEPAVTVTDANGKAIPTDAINVVYSKNIHAGTAKVTVTAKSGSGYTGSAEKEFKINPAALTSSMVKAIRPITYTGKALKPEVEVASGVTYEVAYSNNTVAGKATATIKGTGNYEGTITRDFVINPAKEAITSAKAGKKKITVAYKAQAGSAKYRIVCKASGLKAVAVNTTATQKTITNLKSKKSYQVKVRAYTTVNGKAYYGAYSKVKTVKVK